MSLSAVKQPGIAVAYEHLLGFDGDEFYTAKWPVRFYGSVHRQMPLKFKGYFCAPTSHPW